MKTRKAYAYAYAGSPYAETLGHGKTGCYYISQEVKREDGTWSPGTIWPGSEGEAAATWAECGPLRDLYAELNVPVSPYCLTNPQYGFL